MHIGDPITNLGGPGSFIEGIDLYSTYLPSEGFDDAIDDTFIDIDDDSNIDVVKLDYIETHFDKVDFYQSLHIDNLHIDDLYKKDLFDVQYIDTGLMSQDVYKVDMNVNTSIRSTFDSGNLDSFLYSSDALFAAVQGRKLSDIADSIPATMIGDWSPIKGSGLSLFLEIDVDDDMLSALYLGGDKLTENDFPTGMMREYFDTQSGHFADFFHIVAERDSKFKTLSVGYGLDSETELISKSSVSGIENNIPFTLFGANYDDVIVGSNLMFSGVKIYGKDDVLLRDFIPAVAVVDIDDESYISDGDYIEQGTIGLYDLVEGKFYPNAGTGNFTFDGYTPGIAGIADVGMSGDGFNQFNVIYKRNVHTAYFITPYILKGSAPALYFSDEATYEKLLENDDVIVAPNGMLCRLLEKKDYRYEQPIEAPSDTFDLFNRSLIGWTAFTTDEFGHLNHYNDSDYDSSASGVDGFFDPYYFENDPFTMIDEDIYFVAETYSLDQHNSPKINLDVSYIDEEGTPIYEVKPNQVISLLSDEPNTVIRYAINSIPIAMFANDDYSNSFAVTTDMFDADGYCYIYACVTSNIEDSGTEEGMFASMSPISCFVLHTDFWGDVTPEDLELSMDTIDPRDIPHGLWMAGGEEEYMKVYDPTVKEYKLNGNVYYYNTLLTEGKDYTISYKNNKKVGVASATIKCKGNYTGTIATSFNILPLELGEGDISYVLNTDAFAYKLNKVQKPTVKAVYYNMYDSLTETYSSVKLTNKTDYVVSFPDNGGNTGSFDMYITLKGNYTQENDYLEFADVYVIGEPGDKPISSLKISGIKDYPWNGDYIEQNNLVVKDGKNTLTEGIDYDVDYYNNTLPGVAVMVISGNGIGEGYIGSVTKTFKIKGTDISKLKFSGLKSSYLYDGGNEIRPRVTVKDGSTVLHEYDEYYVDYLNNRSTGTATITFYGNPEYGYVGTKKLTFKIKGTPLSQYNKTDIGTYFYTGSPIELEQADEELYYTQKVNGYEEYYYLPRYNDVTFLDNYVLSYKNNINAGTATVTYTGVNAYSGTVTKTFKINALPLYFSNLIDVEGVDEDTDYYKTQPYQKGGVKPTFTITHKALDPYSLYDNPNADTRELVFGKDYTVTYKNNTKVSFDEDGEVVSEALAIVKGKGNYTGTIEIPFLIEKQEISNTVISIPDVAFTGKTNVKPSVSITDIDGKKLVAGSDYNKTFDYYYSFDSIVYDTTLKALALRKAGEAVLTTDIVYPGTYVDTNIEGLNNYTGSATVRYCVCVELINKASVTVRTQYCTGNGQPVSLYKEDISVKIDGSLLSSDYYEIVGYENNTKAGTAKVTIKGKGYFGGEKTVSFKIVNKPVNSLIFRFYSCSLDGDYWYRGSMSDFKVTIADLIKGSVYLPTSKINDYGYIYPGWTTRDYEYLDDEERISIDDYYDLLQDYDGVIDLFPSYPY